ncbi:MAG: AlpA family transcriptional regulator [Rhodanobacter sp.]
MSDTNQAPNGACSTLPAVLVAFCFLRLPEVCRVTGLSRSQIYRLEAAGQFPQHVKLGASASAWIDREVAQWQADRIAASREVAA